MQTAIGERTEPHTATGERSDHMQTAIGERTAQKQDKAGK